MTLSDIRLTFGGEALFEAAALSVEPRARIALVGRNGSGKSTLLKIAAGQIEPDGGECYLDPGVTVSYLAQEPDLSQFETVGGYIGEGLNPASGAHDTERLIADLGLAPGLSTKNLSGGEVRRAALARALAAAPDILLLDEPTNHLDLPAIEWLETILTAMNAAIVIISHDRRFLESVTTRTAWIDRGQTREIDRGFGAFESWRDKFLEEEEIARHKLDRKIVREEHWVRYGVTARRKRNMRRMAELDALRKTRREKRRAQGLVKFSAAQGKVSGKRVIVADKISKNYDGRPIVKDFSIEIARGDRIGFVGPNGAGKTTLVNLLIGALTPDDGAITLGTNLEIVSLDQRRASLDPAMRLADAITDGRGDWVTIGDQKKHVSSYLQDFLFTTDQWRTEVGALSGGERGRLALAAALAKPSNLLILDEPTNDLDLETLDLLEELLANYLGTLLLVSHDRSFLDRLATSVVTPDRTGLAGAWIEYAGGYSDMVAQRGAKLSGLFGARKIHPPGKKKNLANEVKQSGTPQAAAKSKLSFKEKYALEQLPTRIEKLEQEIATLKARLADPEFFEQDASAFKKAASDLSTAEQALTAAEEEWLALEMKREALE